MASFLIVFSTTDGHTKEICLRLKQIIERQSHQVTMLIVDDALSIEIEQYDKIILGASIRYGKHSPLVHQFIQSKKVILENKPNAFFSVNLVARKPEKNSPETNPYFSKFINKVSWQPQQAAVFAGKIDYPRYTFWDRWVIRFIMWLTKGPTDPQAVVDFTNWQQVEDFGHEVSLL